MGISSYLPSAQFSVILTSVLLAGGLIWAADYYTSPRAAPTIVPAQTPSAVTADGLDWKAALTAIQGENTLPSPPSKEAVAGLLAASQTSNVTDSVARGLLINLGEAKVQGLGSDIPTQERIVAEALAKLKPGQEAELYTITNLATVADTPQTLRAYGNAVIEVLNNHPKAVLEDTLLAVGNAVDLNDPSQLKSLDDIEAAYRGIASDLVVLVVPQTLSPLHLQVVNNLVLIATTHTDMRAVLTDPLRGLAALKLFQSLTGETGRLFINIAQALDKNGILFSEEEPGYAWNLLVAP